MTKEKKIFVLSGSLLAVIFLGAFLSFAYFWKPVDINIENKVISKDDTLAGKNKKENEGALKSIEGIDAQAVRAISDSDHILGDKNAPVQVVVYSDFQCQFCAKFADTIKQVEEEFKDKVVIAFRHFPLSFNALAMPAAIASECAGEQGKFWEMYEKLFADNRANNFSAEQFRIDAKNIGLDMKKFDECFKAEKYIGKIQGQIADAKTLGIYGAPASFINGEVAPGAYPLDDFTDTNGDMIKGMRSRILKFIK